MKVKPDTKLHVEFDLELDDEFMNDVGDTVAGFKRELRDELTKDAILSLPAVVRRLRIKEVR